MNFTDFRELATLLTDSESLTKADSSLMVFDSSLMVYSSNVFGSDLTLHVFLLSRYFIAVLESRMIFLSTFDSLLGSLSLFSFVITSVFPDESEMPRRFAKKYSSCLKGWPPTKEVMKEERREEEQEGREMQGELPAWEGSKNIITYRGSAETH